MGALFDEIEKKFSTKVSFVPEGEGWSYTYTFPDTFPPAPTHQQGMFFLAKGEKAGAKESISNLVVEFKLGAENCLDFLDDLDTIIQKLGGTVESLEYYIFRPRFGSLLQPDWMQKMWGESPYMVWGNRIEGCVMADLGELKSRLTVEKRSWWRSLMGLEASEPPHEGIYCYGGVRIAFPALGREQLSVYIGDKAVTKDKKLKEQKQSKAKILVVDDNVLTLELLEMLLRSSFAEEELDIITCEQGPAVFGLALEHNPGLILLDIMMPEKNGLEVLEELKADERTKDIKVVMLSVLSSEETVRRALDLGADKYLTKPFVPYDINEVIREMLLPEWQHIE